MNEDRDVRTIEYRADTRALTDQLRSAERLASSFGKTLTTAFADIVVKGKSVGDTLKSMALRLSELALKAALKPLENLFSNAASGLFGGLFGGSAPAFTPFAKGGVVSNGLPIPFARGGVVASPTTFPLAGGRAGLMGEAGPEAIMPLRRGADGRLGVAAAGGGGGAGVNVTFNVTSPDSDSFRRSETEIGAMLARAVAQGQRNL
ncbi:MAG: phage tail tape measure protein [Pseudomonadota bacterium]